MVIAAAAVVAALRKAEAGRGGRLEEALAATVIEGATGTLRFDERRGRVRGPIAGLAGPALRAAGPGDPPGRARDGGFARHRRAASRAGGRVVEAGGVRLVFVSNVTDGAPGDGMDFSRQATSMFLKAEAALRLEGLSFRDVVRTRIYLADIDRDYAALNGVRRQFFSSRGVHPPPASTGIGGIPDPPDRACGLDLRAIARGGAAQVRPIGALSMCEAPAYGSHFSRGMLVDFPGHSVICVSSGSARLGPAEASQAKNGSSPKSVKALT